MKVKKFENNSYKKYDFVKSLIKTTKYKDFKFSFAATGIIAFTKNDKSVLIIDDTMHLKYHSTLEDIKIKSIGGYTLYFLNKELKNPFFNNGSKLESIFYFDDKDEELAFKKCKYLVNKIFVLAAKLEHYPEIYYDSKRSVQVKICTHDSDEKISVKDEVLADRITDVWNTIN